MTPSGGIGISRVGAFKTSTIRSNVEGQLYVPPQKPAVIVTSGASILPHNLFGLMTELESESEKQEALPAANAGHLSCGICSRVAFENT
jgi:hypothetical protein